jgi:hypothetical protein
MRYLQFRSYQGPDPGTGDPAQEEKEPGEGS